MTYEDWPGLLKSWSKFILASRDYRELIPAELIDEQNLWIGYPGASEAQIRQTENRLKTRLPQTYREFLKITNGWPTAGPYVGRILPVHEIEWVAARRRDWLENWKLGMKFGFGIDNLSAIRDLLGFDHDLLEGGLQISNEDVGIYLLIPGLKSEAGEWEAWCFEGETGAIRHRSFWDLMQYEFDIQR
jgi:hypothetical protein